MSYLSPVLYLPDALMERARKSKSARWRNRAARIDFYCQRQRTRRQLAALSPEQLCDIGLSAEQAKAESQKPFWR